MDQSYEQLHFEFIESRKVSLFTRLVSVGLSLTIAVIPLVEILPNFKYIHNIYDRQPFLLTWRTKLCG